MTVLIGLALIAGAGVLFGYLAVTHRPAPDPYDQPHRDVEPWPTP